MNPLSWLFPLRTCGLFLSQPKDELHARKGYVEIGSRIFEFSPQTPSRFSTGAGSMALQVPLVLGNGTTRLEDGSLFGFEIGWGFGDMSAATENMLFYNGKGHKIGEVHLENNIHKDYMQPWVFSSSDGRFEMTMTPGTTTTPRQGWPHRQQVPSGLRQVGRHNGHDDGKSCILRT